MKILFRLLDIIVLLLISVFIYGILTMEETTNLVLFLVLTLALISYFILNYISRIRLYRFINVQKKELVDEEKNLEKKFDEIKGGKFKNLTDFKAYVGENNLRTILEKFEGKKRIISNLVIREKEKFTHEIDVILIHTSGVYVFESKNMFGKITGKADEKEWKCDYGNGRIEPFYNPIMQNDGHIRALKNLIAHNDKRLFKSFIVFTNRLESYNIDFPKRGWVHIIKQSSLLEKLNKQAKYSENILSDFEIDSLADTLIDYMNSFPENKYFHKNKFRN